jgi:antitoxin component HigA of HigAB toxin-antitoxin module
MLAGSSLNPYFAVPFGDMMISGCIGLIAAAMDQYPQFQAELNNALTSRSNVTAPWDI